MEATKAWRIRRTRGEITRRRLLAAVLVVDFFLVVLFDFAEVFSDGVLFGATDCSEP